MEIPIIHLPLDESGLAHSHLKEESYPITEEGYGLLYPSWGPFYTDSVVVIGEDGEELKRGLDWEPFLPYQQANLELGQYVHRGIIVKRSNIPSVIFKRQVVGGEYANSNIAFDDLLKEFRNHRHTVTWDEIIKPPTHNPNDHPHHMNDLMGTQDMVGAILELAEVLRWYLTGRLIEVENVTGLREALTELERGINNNDGAIQQLNTTLNVLSGAVETLSQTVATNHEFSQSVAESLVATSQDLDSLENRVKGTEQGLTSLSEHQIATNQQIEAINQAVENLIETNNSYGYQQVIVNNSTTLTRLHRTSLYDKVVTTNTTHSLHHEHFKEGDTVSFTSPLYGNYLSQFDAPDGLFLLPDNTESTTLSLSGNGGVTWRYLGNRRFLVMEIR